MFHEDREPFCALLTGVPITVGNIIPLHFSSFFTFATFLGDFSKAPVYFLLHIKIIFKNHIDIIHFPGGKFEKY